MKSNKDQAKRLVENLLGESKKFRPKVQESGEAGGLETVKQRVKDTVNDLDITTDQVTNLTEQVRDYIIATIVKQNPELKEVMDSDEFWDWIGDALHIQVVIHEPWKDASARSPGSPE